MLDKNKRLILFVSLFAIGLYALITKLAPWHDVLLILIISYYICLFGYWFPNYLFALIYDCVIKKSK